MLPAIRHPQVRRSVRLLFLGSGLLFLATIVLGIANVFVEVLSRGQILAHFHSGSIGWVTLSVLAVTIWAFTGERDVSDAYASFVWLVAGVGLIAVAGYVAAFGIVFHTGADQWLLPLFGIPSGLAIISTFVFAAKEIRHQPVVTTPHILLLGALLVASIGVTMGILIGLSHAGIAHLFPDRPDADVVGAHAGPMDMYLALAFGAVAEMFLGGGRRTKAGMTQMGLGVASGIVAWFALYVGIGPAVPVALLLFVASFLVFFIRIGWRGLRPDWLTHRPAVFFGSLGFPAYIGLFVYAVAAFFSKGLEAPHLIEVIFVHVTFVAMATNWLFAVHASFNEEGRQLPGFVTMGVWTMNVGLLAFFVGERVSASRHGALLMGIGALMAWAAVMGRTWAMRTA